MQPSLSRSCSLRMFLFCERRGEGRMIPACRIGRCGGQSQGARNIHVHFTTSIPGISTQLRITATRRKGECIIHWKANLNTWSVWQVRRIGPGDCLSFPPVWTLAAPALGSPRCDTVVMRSVAPRGEPCCSEGTHRSTLSEKKVHPPNDHILRRFLQGTARDRRCERSNDCPAILLPRSAATVHDTAPVTAASALARSLLGSMGNPVVAKRLRTCIPIWNARVLAQREGFEVSNSVPAGTSRDSRDPATRPHTQLRPAGRYN
jgi:hypothetical protein